MGTRRTISVLRRAAKIAPNTATPTEPPIERKKVAVDVAAPMSRGAAEFCATSTSTGITVPMPMPTTSMYSEDVARVVSTWSSERRYMPSVMIAAPATGKIL